MFMDWSAVKIASTQSDLQAQCNLYQNPNDSLSKKQKNPTLKSVASQGTPTSPHRLDFKGQRRRSLTRSGFSRFYTDPVGDANSVDLV